ncbi:MAG: cellulase family glycosylhydrolase [bacterium]|nr:cellulase family glycosylhydrolase [bacterium]MCM1376445.1 cellulase family glycosylhydrolase [Muribaculum sp.]
MKEISEQKYSRNLALSLLAGIVLGAAIVLVMLWALGYIPKDSQRETGADAILSGDTALATGGEASQEDISQREPSSESQESAPEPEESSKPSPKPTQEPQLEEASKPADAVQIGIDLQLSSSWDGEDGHYYQYAASIENLSDRKITDWEITVPGFDDCKVDSYWCCEVDVEDDSLIITPADFNEEIEKDGRVEGIGITVLAKKEWELEAATIEAETDQGKLTAALGDAVATRDEQTQESQPSESANPAQSQGAKGPDIHVGDTLAGHALTEDSPVGEHGRLRVENGQLVDQDGEAYQMHGVSTHGLAWFPEYVSEEAFRTLRNNWDADVMRLAMYSDEYGGYSNGGDQKELKKLIDKGVEYASKLGMYVIIDWHVLGEGDPNIHKEDAIAFFDEMSAKYADYGNVIYEICNEPNGGVSWKDVKSYAQEVIPVIRANDPYGIILVGTPQWSQLIGEAAADPIEDYDNIMYTLHFYAATHKEDLRGNLEKALKDGVPVFVSECSICDASGNGGIDEKSAKEWVELLDKYDVSFVAWSLCNKNETAALVDSGCGKLSDWSDQELSDTGRWFKEEFTK